MLYKLEADVNRIIGEEINEVRLKEAEDYFYSLIKPVKFWDADGASAKHNKGFESACAIISQNSSRNPKKMTTLEYLQTLEELRHQSKRMQTNNRGK